MNRKSLHRLSTACLLIALAVNPLGAQERFYFRNVQGQGVSGNGNTPPGGGEVTPPGGGTNAPASATVGASFAYANNAPVSVVPAFENVPLPVTWSIAPPLRNGLDFDPTTGSVSGSTTIAGTTTHTLTVTGGNKTANAQFELTVAAQIAPPPVISSYPSSFQFVAGEPISIPAPSVSGGTGTLVYSISPAAFPLTFSTSTGLLSWETASAGNYGSYTVSVTDQNGVPTAANPFSIVVLQPLGFTSSAIPGELPYASSLAPYGMSASGGVGPYTYTLASGALPDNVTLNETTGQLAGSPLAGDYSFSIKAEDSSNPKRSATTPVKTFTVYPQMTSSGNAQTVGTVGTPLAAGTTSASGGKGPYTYSVNVTPAGGISFDTSTGSFVGTPTAPQSLTYVVTATDALGTTSLRPQQTLHISSPLSITTTALPDVTQLTPYSAQIASTGGRGPYVWSTPAAGAGATESPESFVYANTTTGTITATGATSSPAGTRTLTFTVTDVDGRTDTKTLNINVVAGTPGASRSLIANATYTGGSLSTDLLPYSSLNTVGVSGSINSTRMTSIAKDETVYATSSMGSSVLKQFRRGEEGVLLRVVYSFQQPVLITRIDQNFSGAESPSGCSSARMNVSYETGPSNTGPWTALGNYSLGGTQYKIATNGPAGPYYALTATVPSTTTQYVRMTMSASGYSGCGNTSFNWMFYSGVVR